MTATDGCTAQYHLHVQFQSQEKMNFFQNCYWEVAAWKCVFRHCCTLLSQNRKNIVQLKYVLWKYKFNFNGASYSILMALMIPLLIHKSVNHFPETTVAQAVWDSKSVIVYWRDSLTFIPSQLTNQAGLRINKSFLQGATPHFVQMLPSIITHLKQGRFSNCWPDKVATSLTQGSLQSKRRMQRTKVTYSN